MTPLETDAPAVGAVRTPPQTMAAVVRARVMRLESLKGVSFPMTAIVTEPSGSQMVVSRPAVRRDGETMPSDSRRQAAGATHPGRRDEVLPL